MKIKMDVELLDFKVPNYVIVKPKTGKREEGFKEAPKYHLRDLSSATLEQLCSNFRDAVFRKAEKRQVGLAE